MTNEEFPTKTAKDVVVGETVHVYGHDDFVVRGRSVLNARVLLSKGNGDWVTVRPNELVTIVQPVPVVHPQKLVRDLVAGDTLLDIPERPFVVDHMVPMKDADYMRVISRTGGVRAYGHLDMIPFEHASEAEHPTKKARDLVVGDTILSVPKSPLVVARIKTQRYSDGRGEITRAYDSSGMVDTYDADKTIPFEPAPVEHPQKKAKYLVVGDTIHDSHMKPLEIKRLQTVRIVSKDYIRVRSTEGIMRDYLLDTLVPFEPAPVEHKASKESIEQEIRLAKHTVANAEIELRKATAHLTRMEITLELMEKN